MSTIGATEVPLWYCKNMLNGVKGNDLSEEVEALISLLSVGEIRKGSIAPISH